MNVEKLEYTYDPDDPEGFRSGGLHIGRQIGSKVTGTSLYELPPGQSLCPYHYEYGEEEWLLVLQGTPTLRTPEGTERLEPFDVVFFQPGPEGAHAVRNDTDETIRIVMYSTVTYPAATVYPDSDKIGIWTGNDDDSLLVLKSSRVQYYDGEV